MLACRLYNDPGSRMVARRIHVSINRRVAAEEKGLGQVRWRALIESSVWSNGQPSDYHPAAKFIGGHRPLGHSARSARIIASTPSKNANNCSLRPCGDKQNVPAGHALCESQRMLKQTLHSKWQQRLCWERGCGVWDS